MPVCDVDDLIARPSDLVRELAEAANRVEAARIAHEQGWL